MCYDYHGKWDKRTGHNAPLGPRPDEAGADLTLNLEYTVQYLLQVGVMGHESRVTGGYVTWGPCRWLPGNTPRPPLVGSVWSRWTKTAIMECCW